METDLSTTGISVPAGMQAEGIDLMRFISFNSNIELSAWGYNDNNGQRKLSPKISSRRYSKNQAT